MSISYGAAHQFTPASRLLASNRSLRIHTYIRENSNSNPFIATLKLQGTPPLVPEATAASPSPLEVLPMVACQLSNPQELRPCLQFRTIQSPVNIGREVPEEVVQQNSSRSCRKQEVEQSRSAQSKRGGGTTLQRRSYGRSVGVDSVAIAVVSGCGGVRLMLLCAVCGRGRVLK